MRFYDREKEIAELRRLDALAEHHAQLTVLMGRRRTGKTSLMMVRLKDSHICDKKAEQTLLP